MAVKIGSVRVLWIAVRKRAYKIFGCGARAIGHIVVHMSSTRGPKFTQLSTGLLGGGRLKSPCSQQCQAEHTSCGFEPILTPCTTGCDPLKKMLTVEEEASPKESYKR